MKIPRALRAQTLVVRGGVDSQQPEREGGHRLPWVYAEMLYDCVVNLPGLPDPRTLTMSEIRWFYERLRPSLREMTKPREKPKH